MTPERRTIVEQLRQAIVDSGESEYAVGKATGVSQTIFSRFINSERGISIETAAKLCSYLKLDLLPRR